MSLFGAFLFVVFLAPSFLMPVSINLSSTILFDVLKRFDLQTCIFRHGVLGGDRFNQLFHSSVRVTTNSRC